MARVFVSLQDTLGTWVNKHNKVVETVGDMALLNTLEDSSLVQVVNELHDSLDAATLLLGGTSGPNNIQLNTTSDSVAGAINEHEADIGDMIFTGLSATDISAALRELRTELGDHTALTTTATNNIVAAINEINAELYNSPDGSGSNFTTTATTVEGAINELDSDVGNRSDLNTLLRGSMVEAINEVHDSVTGLQAFVGGPNGPNGPNVVLDTLADSVVGAINELHDSVDQLNTFVDPDTALNTTATTVSGAINEHETDIGNMTLTGYAANNISAALREAMTELGDVTALNTTASTAVTAINEHETDIGNMTFTGLSATDISAAIRELRTELGDHTALTTTATNNVVAAINEINAELYTSPDGSGSNFNTDATTIEGAINEFEAALRNSTGGGVSNYTLSTLKQTIVEAINELHDSQSGIKTLLGGTASDTQIALRTTSDSVVGAVNEVDSQMSFVLQALGLGDPNTAFGTYTPGTDTYTGDLGQLTTNIGDKSSIRHAINDIQDQIDTIETAAGTTNTNIGSLANLDDEIQRPTVVGAINSLRDSVLAIYDSLTVDNLTFNDNIIRSNSTDGEINLRHGGPGVASEFTYLTIKRFADSDTLITTDAGGSGILLADSAVTIQGNLRVQGTTTYVNTETVEIDDNIILLNANVASGVAGTENAGLEVNRGSLANAFIRWNETDDKWEATMDNAGTIETILTTSDKSGISGNNINDNAITNAKLADMEANTVKVRNANSTGDPSNKAVADTEILIGNGAGFTAASLSGDVGMANTGAVTISADAVTYSKMQNLATGNRLLGGAAAGEIGEVQVATDMIANDAVTYAKMQHVATANRLLGSTSAAGAVSEVQVQTGMYADSSITNAKLQHHIIEALQLKDSQIAAQHLVHNAVETINIGNDQVTYDKIQNVASNNVLLGNDDGAGSGIQELSKSDVLTLLNVADGANAYSHPNHSGDVTSSGDGSTTIANNAVTYAKMQDASAGFVVIGKTNTGAGDLAEIAVSANNVIGRSGSGNLQSTQVTNAMLAGSIANGKLSNSSINIAGQDVALGGTVLDSIGDLPGFFTSGSFSNAAGQDSTQTIAIGHNDWSDTFFPTTSVMIGWHAGKSVTATPGNVVSIGYGAGKNNDGDNNTSVGYQAMGSGSTTTGDQNVVLGSLAGYEMSGADSSVMIGYRAGYHIQNGDGNTIVGSFAGPANAGSGAAQNVIIGAHAGDAATSGNNNILIGWEAQKAANTNSNEIVLGNNNNTRLRIPGIDLDTNSATNGQALKWNTSTGGFEWFTPTGTTYSAGNYLNLSGTTFNVNAGSTLLILNSAGTTLKTIVSLGTV